MTRVLAWAAIATLTVYLVFIGGGWAGIYLPEIRTLSMALAGLGLAAWAVVAWREPRWRPQTRLWPAIAAALASLAIATAFSRYPRVSLEYLGYAVVLAALYLLLVRLLADPFFRRRLVGLMTMLFLAVVGAYLVAVVAHWIEWWRLVDRIAVPPLRPRFEGLTYLNPSAVLTMVALLAVPAAAILPHARRGWAAAAAITGAIGVIAILTGSRAGWVALALTVACAALVALRLPAGRAALRSGLARVRTSRKLQAGVLALAAGALVAAIVVAPAVLRRLGDGGETVRLQYSVVGARLFAQSPIVGTGPGSWVIERVRQTAPTERDFYIPHAHNLEVQTLAEQGLVGAAAALVVVLGVARLLQEAIGGEDATRRRWAWLSAAALAYFVLHQLLDFYANMPAALFAAAFPLAYLDATVPPQTEARARRARLASIRGKVRLGTKGIRPGFAVVTALAVGGLLLQEVPALASAQAIQLANRGDWAAADEPAGRAAEQDPAIAPYLFTAGLAAAHLGDHARAAILFEPVARRDAFPEALLNLAAEQAAVGDTAAAQQSLQSAVRIGRQRAAVGMAAGELALRIGNRPAGARDPLTKIASDAFAGALAAAPLLALDPWWRSDPERQAALGRAISMLPPAAVDDVRWLLRLAVGDIEGAHAAAKEADDSSFIGLLVEAWDVSQQGAEGAARSAYDACLLHPQDLDRQLWCARLASWRGDAPELQRFRTLVEFLSPGAGAEAVVPRIAQPGEPGPTIGGLAHLWGTFTYRRFTPQDMLVPGLLRLVAN